MAFDSVKLRVENLRKVFRVRGGGNAGAGGAKDGLLHVLGSVSFEVRKGEIVSLIGQSGCGKTTLLRIIQGLTRNYGGSVQVDGVVVKSPGRDRGFVFQQPSLLPWRTARKNVEFRLELQGVPKAERARRSMEMLEFVGLRHAANLDPHELSGGMQQRVGLARALVIDPAILLMDEPFSALVAQTREVLQVELMRIHEQTEKSTLFVTHDLDEAIYLSDRVVVLLANPGRVMQIIDVPFAHPRPELTELRLDPRFQDIRRALWMLIRGPDTAAA